MILCQEVLFAIIKKQLRLKETKPMPNTPLKELYNLYRYIQHLILESEFDYDDDEFDDPLDEGNWLLQTRGRYMKFVIYHSSTVSEPRNTSNQKLVSFRKSINRSSLSSGGLMADVPCLDHSLDGY